MPILISKIKIKDIKNIGINKKLIVYLDSDKAVKSVKSLISQYKSIGRFAVKTEILPEQVGYRVEIKRLS